MRKEVITAVLLGILFGLIIAFGIYRANTALRPKSAVDTSLEEQQESDTATTEGAQLTITNPQNYDIVTESSVMVAGLTRANDFIIVSGENEDFVIRSESNGEFAQEVDLIPALNRILIHHNRPNGAVNSVTVVQSSNINFGTSDDEEVDEAESESSLEQRIEDRLAAARSILKAMLGFVSDIVDGTLQITNDSGEIRQISTSETTTFGNIVNTPADIEVSDIAIGDYIIAMGNIDDNQILDAARVVVTEPPGELTRKLYFAAIQSIESRTITIISGENSVEATFPRSWKGPEIAELSEGDEIALVLIDDDGELTVRTIELLSSFQSDDAEQDN